MAHLHRGRDMAAALVYSSVVIGALRVCAEASGWLCGKRLAPFLAELVPALRAGTRCVWSRSCGANCWR